MIFLIVYFWLVPKSEFLIAKDFNFFALSFFVLFFYSFMWLSKNE